MLTNSPDVERTKKCRGSLPGCRSPHEIQRRETRKQLLVLVITALVLLMNAHMNNAQNVKWDNGLEKQHFHLISPESPSFQAEVSSILDDSAASQLAPVLPHSLIAVNNTGRNIWSFTIIYTYPDDQAASGEPRRIIVSQSAPMRTAPDRMLQPGDKFLVTALRNVVAASQVRTPMPHSLAVTPALSHEISAYKTNQIDTNKRVQISVDSVIFEDGEIVGPDTAGREIRINGRLDADRSLVEAVTSRQGDDLKKYLTGVAAQSVTDEYHMYLTGLAGNFLAMLNSQGEDSFRQTVARLRTIEPFNNHRVARRQL